MNKKKLYKSIVFTKQVWFLTARLGFGLFVFITSLYCLLSYIPFTYHWLIKGDLISWLGGFVKFHTFLYWVLFLMVATTLVSDIRRKRTRILSFGFIAFHTVCGIALLLRPLLPDIENNQRSLVWSLIVITPLIWLSVIDFLSKQIKRPKQANQREDNLRFSTAFLCSIFVSVLYSAILVFQYKQNRGLDFEELTVATVWSFVTHLLIFVVSVAVLRVIRVLSKRFSDALIAEFILCNTALVLIVAAVIRYFIFPRISFTDYRADIFSFIFAFTILFFLSSLNIKLARSKTLRTSSGLEMALRLITPSQKSSTATLALWICTISFAAYFIPVYFAKADWDFLLQKLSVFFVWFLSFGFFLSTPSQRTRIALKPVRVFVLVTAAGLGFYQTLGLTESFERLAPACSELKNVTERYAGKNLSFQIAREILSRPLNIIAPIPVVHAEDESIAESEEGKKNFFVDRSYANFYELLKQNTSLAPSVKIDPVDIKLAEKTKDLSGEKPNIFIFVVDSLRQDYLSPYNKNITFTPSIESFAKESVVFQNSFTRYGGTVLSEPAIWTGALIPHKQYIEPFYPLNSLQKLVDAENYEQMITMDPVLKIILRPSTSITELDAQSQTWTEFDLCRTVQEIQTKIEARQTNERPLFVYTQPQNLHLRRLELFRKKENGIASFEGLDEIYGSEVKKIDGGFGQFVQYLKAKGLYDNSIIILTSDHGDSLGEEGRWGHSYWMFPEIIRVPLIVHLPSRMQKTYQFNTRAVAFSMDITPSLYYLLGYRPIADNPLFGRPLFTETLKEHNSYVKDMYFLASSYGAVYTVLSGNGRNLFIADAVNNQNYSLEIEGNGKLIPKRIAAQERTKYENFISKQFDEMKSFYNFAP